MNAVVKKEQVAVEVKNEETSKATASERRQISVSWKNLNYEVLVKKKGSKGLVPKKILENLNGVARPGELLVLMGPSGAGKTSLLNCLAGRNTKYNGDILLNGIPWNEGLRRHTSFVQQHDLFIPVLTVREHLDYQSLLRMDRSTSKEQKKLAVDNVIRELGLLKCQNTAIGTPGVRRGISGGEMKRLAFASEVLGDPSVMFVDEPTSGLDSFMAKSVVEQMKALSKQGRTIIATIHQPSSDIFAMFDRLMLLADGKLAYLGSREASVPYFKSIGFECPPFLCPGDFFMNHLSIEASQEEESHERVERLVQAFAQSKLGHEMLDELNAIVISSSSNEGEQRSHGKEDSTKTGKDGNRYTTSTWNQFTVLLSRQTQAAFRHPILFKAKLGQTIVISGVVALLFWQLDNTQKGVQDFNGALFFVCVNQSFGSAFPIVGIFPDELPIFLREHKGGMYSIFAYYMAMTISDLPLQLFFPLLAGVITYFTVGLALEVEAFFIFQLVLILLVNAAVSLAYVISSVASSTQVANAIAPAALLPFMLFGGLFMNESNIPAALKWFGELSFIKYGFNALAINEWTRSVHDNIPCQDSSICLYQNGSQVLRYLSIDEGDLWYNITMNFVLVIIFRVLAFFFLLRRSYKPETK